MPRKILIVEDNAQNMRVILMTLRAHDYTLLKASNGEEALSMVSREKPDLIIMDVQLPKIDGLEVTRRIRQIPTFRNIPIIAITAHAMKGDKRQIMGAGCNAYIPKPINTRELPGVINELLVQV